MPIADEVRTYCARNIVEIARRNGLAIVRIRAGDVHRALQYQNRLPAVVAALGANIFCRENDLTRISVEGPLNGANTVLVFKVH